MHNWYLLYTKPKNEDHVTSKLSDRGFEVFNPLLRERRYIRRKLQDVVSPLFPCYVFVRFSLPEDYRLIRYTRGVRKVVGTEDLPTPVPVEIIDSIRSRMVEGVVSVRPKAFMPGEEVVIKGGPLQGIDAIFEREMNGFERVCVLLKAVNARVVVDRGYLDKA